MKRILITLSVIITAFPLCGQTIRVLSNDVVGQGFNPRLSEDAQMLSYLVNETDEYPMESNGSSVHVFTEDLQLYVEVNGVVRHLTPHGSDVNYIWESLSPNGQMILFNTRRGTAICDLQGQLIRNLGQGLDAPVWYGNDYIVAMNDQSDGHYYTGSSIVLAAIDGSIRQELTSQDAMAMYPSVSATTGKVAYQTLDGELHVLQTNLCDRAIHKTLPRLQAVTPVARMERYGVKKKNIRELKIYINPGHGGHGSNDRGMTIYPFASGDVNGFWESNSNLDKGLMLDSMLVAMGAQTKMSRRTNNDGGGNDVDVLTTWLNSGKIDQAQYNDMLANGDDRSLSAIVAEANAYGADFMLSIHSNAGTPSNYVLELYAGKELSDTHTYSDEKVKATETKSRDCSTLIGQNLWSNGITTWSGRTAPYIAGDKTFGRNIMGWSNGYGVLRNLKVPGVISEGCMHDYKPETYRLMNMDYKKQEAWNFLRSFCTYFLNYSLPTGAIGGQVRDSYNQLVFPDIYRTANSRDDLNPLLGATVTLIQSNIVISTYTTDSLYNGVYFFWDLPPGTYTIRAEKEGFYTQEHQVTVVANQITYQDQLMDMERASRPVVTNYCPNPSSIEDSIQVSTEIYFDFNWDMLVDSAKAAFSITPAVAGTISFENSNKTMRFKPTANLDAGVEYEIRISTKACHPDSLHTNHLAEDFVLRFRTSNRANYRIMQSYPANGQEDITLNPQMILILDAPVNSKTVMSNLSVTDANGNTQSLNGRSAVTNNAALSSSYGYISVQLVNALRPNTDYTFTIGPGLSDKMNVTHSQTTQIPFRTGDAAVTIGTLIDNMEQTSFCYNEERSVSCISASVLRNTNIKYEGTASNELMYRFDNTASTAEVTWSMNNPSAVIGNNKSSLSFFLLGDLSGNQLMAEWNCEGDIQYTPVCTIDFSGWKYVQADMSSLPEGMRYQFTGLKLIYQAGLLSSRGSIYVDNLMAIQASENTALPKVQIETQDSKYIQNGLLIIQKGKDSFDAAGKHL